MDDRVLRLTTPEDCKKFAKNAVAKGRHDLALQARRHAVDLRAAAHGASKDVEEEALKAIYAYEELLSAKNGRTTRASRTWQMIKRHGIIEAIERSVNRTDVTKGYQALVEMGMGDLAFESIITRYPEHFSAAALQISTKRMKEWSTQSASRDLRP